MTYRPDIDGLRAVAVIAVILFHLNSTWLPGGFLGVDIFFVISGYLIGGILFREISTKTFSLKRFYLRRMRRILPAFFAVVLFGLSVGAWIMVPESDEWNAARSAARWSLGFAGNIFLAQNTDYFAPSAEVQPFNHLWSLGVEEQFYFLYPLLLWVLMKGLHKVSNSALPKLGGRLNWLLALLTLGSFALAKYPVTYDGKELIAYYLPHLRFGELLIGAMLAVGMKPREASDSSFFATFVGIVSSIALLLCLLLPFPNTLPWFPGFAAVVPCLATAGILYAGAQRNMISRVLSLSPMVFVGRISYSLYLWHWPLLAFAHYMLGNQLTYGVLLGIFALTFAFSLLSFYLIEQPLRHRQWSFAPTALAYYVLPAVAVVFLSLQGNTRPEEMRAYLERGSLTASEKELTYKSVGDTTAPRDVLIIGNSHTMQLHDFFDKVGKHEGWQATFSGVNGTFPNALENEQPISSAQYDEALKQVDMNGDYKKELNYLRTARLAGELDKYHTVVISLNWWHPEFLEKALPAVALVIDFLQRSGKKVILVNSCYTYNTYRVTETYHRVMGKSPWFSHLLPEPILGTAEYDEAVEKTHQLREQIFAWNPNLQWVDLTEYIPENMLADGKSVLCNTTHLNIYGANYLADRFIASGQRFIQPRDTIIAK